MGFLAPAGDFSKIMSFCNVRQLTDDFEDVVSATESEVAVKCGPVLTTTVTENLGDRATTHVLRARPMSITSLTGTDGTAYLPADFRTSGQVLSRTDGGSIPAGAVVYVAGWAQADIPAGLMTAAKLLCRHLWRTQLGNQRVNEEALAPGSAWLWPAQARELARPYFLAPLVSA